MWYPRRRRERFGGYLWVAQPTFFRKGGSQQSLLGKREETEVVYGSVPQDPRDMAKATLPETQFQEVLRRPTATATKSGDIPCGSCSFGETATPGNEPADNESEQRNEWVAYVTLERTT